MQIKTTMRCYFTPTGTAIIKNTDNNKCWCGEDVEKLEPSCIASGNVKWYSHYGKQFDRSSKNYIVITWPSNSMPRHIPEN